MDRKQIEGQITLWDFLKSQKPKAEPNDSVCEGCKWRKYKNRYLEVDDYGQTWVYCCPGTACANWRNGTPLNLSDKVEIPGKAEEKIYCYNRDFLPELKNLVPILETAFDCTFKEREFEGKPEYYFKYKNSEFCIDDSTYNTGDERQNVRFVGFSWNTSKEGYGIPCDNLHEIIKAFEYGFERAKKVAKEEKERKLKAESEDSEC